MNQDQLTNLIQTVGKIAGAALATKGIGDSTVWEAVTGAVLAIASWYWSHKSNATPDSSTPTGTPQLPPKP